VSSSLRPALPANLLAGSAFAPVATLDRRPDLVLKPLVVSDAPFAQPAKRSKIWDLADTLHCSIIGTCLSNAELRRVLVRLKVTGAETADEHDLHVMGVMLAGRREAGARLLQKALDKRHELAIKQYAKAENEAALRRMWDASIQSGDIPGAYWALLSHPVSSDAIVKKAFRDVHMLSHLVGAANRADVRRLRQLEEQNGALIEKLNRQQQQLRDGFTSRDATIRRLNETLVRQAEHPLDDQARDNSTGGEVETLRGVIAEINRKLGQELARRERLEQRLSTTSAALQKMESTLQRTMTERDALAREVESVEDHVVGMLEPATASNVLRPHDPLRRRTRASDPSVQSAGRTHGRTLPAPRRRHRAQLGTSARPRQQGRSPVFPDRLHQPRCRFDDQTALPAIGETIPALANRKPGDAGVGAGADVARARNPSRGGVA